MTNAPDNASTTAAAPQEADLRLRRLAFILVALAILVLSLRPFDPDLPSTGWDKTNHLLGFGLLAILGCRAWPARTLAVLAALLVYGGLIEVLQSLTDYRTAEWGDWLADGLGLVLGWVIVRLASGLGISTGAPGPKQTNERKGGSKHRD